MKTKGFVILLMILFICTHSVAEKKIFRKTGKAAIFMMNGDVSIETIVFMSSYSNRLGFADNEKININKIWMVNFINKEWNFLDERKELARSEDSIFLKNGKIIHDKIITYSTGRQVFRFKNTAPIHISSIKRIYFCCNRLPKFYKDKLYSDYFTFLLDGRTISSPIVYSNIKKTKFKNKILIDSKNIWMINFINKTRNFPKEMKVLSNTKDSIFLKNGGVIYKSIVFLDPVKRFIKFDDNTQIPFLNIKRIYFPRTKIGRKFKKLNTRRKVRHIK